MSFYSAILVLNAGVHQKRLDKLLMKLFLVRPIIQHLILVCQKFLQSETLCVPWCIDLRLVLNVNMLFMQASSSKKATTSGSSWPFKCGRQGRKQEGREQRSQAREDTVILQAGLREPALGSLGNETAAVERVLLPSYYYSILLLVNFSPDGSFPFWASFFLLFFPVKSIFEFLSLVIVQTE